MTLQLRTSRTADPTEATLEQLRTSKFDFYLTGSRYFGEVKEDSDWDFFAANNTSIRDWLNKAGFVVLEKTSTLQYSDLNVALVYSKGDVQVQLQKDVKAKIAVQDVLDRAKVFCSNDTYYNFHDKLVRRKLWDIAYAAYTAGHNITP